LEGRGVPIEAAEAAGVRYGQWWKRGASGPESFNAVLFPVLDADGQLVAVIARGIVGKVMRTGGDVKQGVFRATLDATSANRIAITESPIDALVLAAVGLDAVGTGGTHWAEWLPDALQDIDVALAQDADKAGDECATKLSSLLPTSWRLRPVGAKDFSEMAELAGLDAVAEMVMDAQSRAPEVQV
jgi:DNA primase